MTPAALEKSLARLYAMPNEKRKKKKAQDEEDITSNATRNQCRVKRKEPTEQDNQIVNRLYTMPIEKQKNQQAKLEAKHHSPQHEKVKLGRDQVEEVVQRMYTQAVEQKRRLNDSCEKKLYGDGAKPKVLEADQFKESIGNLYEKAVQRKKDKVAQLEQNFGAEYSWQHKADVHPNYTQSLDKAAMTSMVERLHAGEKRQM